MANPNIVNVSNIYGNTAYVTPSGTTANTAWTYNGSTSLTGLTPSTNVVNRVTTIVVSNSSAAAANCSVAIANNATYGSGTPFYLANSITVPAGASLIVTDKTTAIYLEEDKCISVTSGTASGITYSISYEEISS